MKKIILRALLESQLDIEKAALKAFKISVEWDGHAIVLGTIGAYKAKIAEIERQLKLLEK